MQLLNPDRYAYGFLFEILISIGCNFDFVCAVRSPFFYGYFALGIDGESLLGGSVSRFIGDFANSISSLNKKTLILFAERFPFDRYGCLFY